MMRLREHPLRPLAEQLTSLGVDRVTLAVCLPAPYRDIDIKRIQLGAETPSAGFLRGDQRRARAHKGVEHDAAALGRVAQHIGDKRYRFDRPMTCKAVVASASENVRSLISPAV